MKSDVLLCFFAIIFMVSANQPITVPLQTYPVYQQDVCRNIQGNVPIILRTSNSNHYTQPNTAQNQIPSDVANVLVNRVLSNPTIHTILDPNTRFYNQNGVEVYNGGAVPQLYNGAAIPNVINNYFIVSPEYLKLNKTDVNAAEHNDFFVNDKINDHTVKKTLQNNDKKHKHMIETILNKPDTKNGKKKKPTKSHRHRKPKSSIRPSEQSKTRIYEKGKDAENNGQCQDSSKPRKIKNRTMKTLDPLTDLNVSKDNTTPGMPVSNNDAEQTEFLKKQLSKSKSGAKISDNDVDINAKSDNTKFYKERSMLDILLNSQKENVESKTPAIKPINENEVNEQHKIKSDHSKTQLEYIEQQILNSDSESIDNRVPRNSKEETIIKDFRQKFPDVPESLARSMLSYIQGQFQNQFGHNFFYPNNYPFNYNHYFQIPQYSNIGRSTDNKGRNRSRRRKQKHRRRNNHKNRNGFKNKNTTFRNSETIAQIKSTIIDKETDLEPKLDNSLTEPPAIESKFEQKIELTSEEHPIEEKQATIETTPTELYFSSFEHLTELPIESTTKLDEIEEYLKEIDFVEIKPEEYIDYNIEDTTVSTLGQEDTVPIMYDNRLIEDYYPIFTDNVDFLDNNNEYHVKNLNDRYYYTTDKNSEFNSNNDIRKSAKLIKEERKIPERIFKESLPRILKYSYRDQIYPTHTYYDADRESLKNIEKEAYQIPRPSIQQKENAQTTPRTSQNEAIEFKTPPGLEFPDFITKKIDKDGLKSNHREDDSIEEITSFNLNDNLDKSSIYSDFKTPMYNGRIKPNAEIRIVKIPSKAKGANVETVYAGSKVAKYGLGSENSFENTASKYPDDSQYHNKDSSSYVTAKSLSYPEEFW